MNVHSNARTCPNSRAVIVDHVRARAWSSDQAAAMGVSARTGFKWWRRYREAGQVGLIDRSSRPHRVPHRTSPERTELILLLRRSRLTAQEIARKLRIPASSRPAEAGISLQHGLAPLLPTPISARTPDCVQPGRVCGQLGCGSQNGQEAPGEAQPGAAILTSHRRRPGSLGGPVNTPSARRGGDRPQPGAGGTIGVAGVRLEGDECAVGRP